MHSHFTQTIAIAKKASFFVTFTLILGLSIPVVAQSLITAQSSAPQDSPLTEKNISATIYLLDPQTLELIPRLVQVPADRPVASAVKQIMQAYHGQDIGIKDCEVSINPTTQEAIINFKIDNPQGAEAFHSLSSANQLALIEAMRETLLNHSVYNVKNVIFTANGIPVEI